ncbi:MAG: phytanoyl-CoA dioxygenase [Chloroflexi bacterium]|nr:MAG: phytanoyl-CoA dioxygenase [Chloroflexota bacterium]
MSFSVTAEQERAFQEDGIVKLHGVVDSRLLDELSCCFDWAVRHPGPTLSGDAEGDEFSFVDLGNPAGRMMYEKLIANSPFGRIAADLWQSEFVGFLSEEVYWKKGKADQTFWHQDTPYVPWRGEHWANFWIPLCDHPADYAIKVVRGSHKGIMYDGTTFNPSDPTEPLWGDAGTFPRLPDISAELAADPASWDIVSFDVEPGDVVVLHPHCVHSGGGADATMPERRTLVLRFFGDKSYYSDHLPDAPGMYENPPIESVNGGYLADGDLFRPERVVNVNL